MEIISKLWGPIRFLALQWVWKYLIGVRFAVCDKIFSGLTRSDKLGCGAIAFKVPALASAAPAVYVAYWSRKQLAVATSKASLFVIIWFRAIFEKPVTFTVIVGNVTSSKI